MNLESMTFANQLALVCLVICFLCAIGATWGDQ